MSFALIMSLAAVAAGLFAVFVATNAARAKKSKNTDGGTVATDTSGSDCSASDVGGCDGGGGGGD